MARTYAVRRVRTPRGERAVVMQGAAGPCAVLAALNACLVRGDVELPAGATGTVGEEGVVGCLWEVVARAGGERGWERVRAVLDGMWGGCTVDVRFCGVEGFVETREVAAFAAFGRLVHGWLVDPQDGALAGALGELSYNEVMDLVVKSAESVEEVEEGEPLGELNGDASGAAAHYGFESREDSNISWVLAPHLAAAAAAPEEEVQPAAPPPSRVSENLHHVLDFLETSAAQMTIYGLAELHAALAEEEVCVLYWNAHFHVLCKHAGELFTLVTDEGYLREPAAVWEKLADVNGDSAFYDGMFERARFEPEKKGGGGGAGGGGGGGGAGGGGVAQRIVGGGPRPVPAGASAGAPAGRKKWGGGKGCCVQ